MTPATYRDLITQATELIEQGRRSMTVRFDDRDAAIAVITDRHAVLSALEAHVWALIGAGNAAGVRSARHPDPVETAALHLAASITQTVGGERPHPSQLAGPHGAWARAARTIRAATDLIAVHHDDTGARRSPTAHLIETVEARDPALAHVAAMALATASVEDALALRVGQTGVPWPTVRRWLPGMDPITDAAEHLATITAPSAQRSLPDVGLLPTRVRTGDVLAEVTDRLARVRQRAWEQVTSPDRSVATLRDLATIAIAVHAHAAAFHAGPNGPASALVARARTWQALGARLATLLSPTPHDQAVRADLTALARLLPTLAPLSGPGRAHEPDPTTRRTGAVLGGAVALMTEIADHNARAFTTITHTTTLYVPARTLTGDEIFDHPELVRARLDGKLAPAAQRQLDDVNRLYQRLRSNPSPAPARGPALGHAAADRAADVEPIALRTNA